MVERFEDEAMPLLCVYYSGRSYCRAYCRALQLIYASRWSFRDLIHKLNMVLQNKLEKNRKTEYLRHYLMVTGRHLRGILCAPSSWLTLFYNICTLIRCHK